jgi:hypothetical protein
MGFDGIKRKERLLLFNDACQLFYCWTTVILQTCIHFMLTISTSSVVPVIGYKENKDDDDDLTVCIIGGR